MRSPCFECSLKCEDKDNWYCATKCEARHAYANSISMCLDGVLECHINPPTRIQDISVPPKAVYGVENREKKCHKWTKGEDMALKQNHGKITNAELANELCVSISQLAHRISRLGLSSQRSNAYHLAKCKKARSESAARRVAYRQPRKG